MILKNVDDVYNWIVRDSDEDLYLYSSASEPLKEKYGWDGRVFVTKMFFPFDQLFQFIKWEDEEPTRIKELLDEYEKKYHNDN